MEDRARKGGYISHKQVGEQMAHVWHKQPSESNKAAFTVYSLNCAIPGMPVCADESASFDPFPNITEVIAVFVSSDFCGHRFYDVDVRKFVFAQLLDQVGELGFRVCHAHTCTTNQLNEHW
jgi:hypothetical protein